MTTTKVKKTALDLTAYGLQQEYDEIFSLRQNKKHKPHIVNAGVVKAGKSTLANALSGNHELFATGVVRTTRKSQMADLDQYILIDTPGVNASEDDTQEAIEAYKNADIILFTHNITDGELLRQEVDFIKDLQLYFPNIKDFWDRVIFVFTNNGQLEKDQSTHISNSILKQINDLFNGPIFSSIAVDSLSYLKGVQENKQLLVQSSNIPSLLELIQEKSRQLNKLNTNLTEQRIQHKKDKIIQALQDKQSILDEVLSPLQNEMEKINSVYTKVVSTQKKLNDGKNHLNPTQLELAKYQVDSVYFGGNYSSGYNYDSEYAAESAAEKQFRSNFYDRAKTEFSNKRNYINRHYQDMLNLAGGNNNPFNKIKTKAIETLNSLKDSLFQLQGEIDGFQFENLKIDLQAKVGEPEDKYLLRTGPYLNDSTTGNLYDIEGCSWYLRANIDTNYITRYKKGWFGETEVEVYNYSFWDAVRDLQNDLTSCVNHVRDEVHSVCNRIYKNYASEINNQFIKVVTQLDKQVQQCRGHIEKQRTTCTNKFDKLHSEKNQITEIIEEIKQL